MINPADKVSRARWQFSIANLLECVTWCSIVAACAPLVGPTAVACLIAMALAVAARHGDVALIMFSAAMIAADAAPPTYAALAGPGNGFGCVFVAITGGTVAGWYGCRRRVA